MSNAGKLMTPTPKACMAAAVVFAAIAGSVVASDEPHSTHRMARTADGLVRHAFVDRVSNPALFKSLGEWDLEGMLPLFDSQHRQPMQVYLARLRQFDRTFGKWGGSVPPYHSFLLLSRFDPLTLCNVPPTSRSMTRRSQTAERAVFTVTYKLPGVRQSYRRDLTLTLAKGLTGWVITRVQYEAGAVPQLGANQTLAAMLELLTSQLDEAIAWAKQHPEELASTEELLQQIPK